MHILIVLQGVHDMGLFLAGNMDLDRALRDNASDLGPPCLLLVWDLYMQVVIYFIL